MQLVADGDGPLAPAARRGLAHLARLAGDFPTAHDVAQSLGWEGRQHRVEGDICWPHGDMNRAASAYATARDHAERHNIAGERATSQAQRAFVLAFTDPNAADDELHLAEQLLTGLDLRATTLTTKIAAFVRDAGALEPVRVLRAAISDAGLKTAEAALELAMCFHHAVQNDHDKINAAISRLRHLTRGGDYTYYVEIAQFMADIPPDRASGARWLDSEQHTRSRWRDLVTTRQTHLAAGR